MKRLILPVFLLIAFSVNAQKWLSSTAKWSYSHYNNFGGGFYEENTTANVLGDTIIGGQLCQVIQWNGANLFPPANYYTYQVNDSIFFLLDNAFVLAFRTKMNIGDTLFLKRPSVDTAICQATNLYYRYRLDSIATYPKSVAPLNAYYFSRADTFKQWAGTNICFVEKIGFNCLPYPYVPACIFDGSNFDLCNYGDSTISGFWMNPNIKACETVGIKEPKSNQVVYSISPNPVSSVFTITIDKFTSTSIEVGLYNMEGQMVKSILMDKKQANIDCSNLSEGLYFLKGKNFEPSKVMVLH